MAWEFESPPGHQLNVMSRRQVCGSFALTAGFLGAEFRHSRLAALSRRSFGVGETTGFPHCFFPDASCPRSPGGPDEREGRTFPHKIKRKLRRGQNPAQFFHADGQRSGWSESLSAADAGTGRPHRRFTGPFFSAERERAFPPCHAVDRRGRSAFPRPVLRL